MNKLNITYHQNYDIPVPARHRFVGTKFSDLFNYLKQQSLFSQCLVTHPQNAPISRLNFAHSQSYITNVAQDSLSDSDLRKINLPWSSQIRQRSFKAVEGTLEAAKLALQFGIACHVGGGTHHAHRNYGYGFCVFNDLAYTAINLIEENYVKTVLILDLDVHQGDGTIDICKDHPAIYTCSIHSESNFPFEKKQGWMDVSIPAGSKDDFYLQQLEITLSEIDERISPDIILYDAGVDIYLKDGLGNLDISLEGIRHRDHMVLNHYRSKGIPVATVIGGGYSQSQQELAARHSIIFETAIDFI